MTQKEIERIFSKGTVREKAILLIKDEVCSRGGEPILTERQAVQLRESVIGNKADDEEMHRYLCIAGKFAEQRKTWTAMIDYMNYIVLRLHMYSFMINMAEADTTVQNSVKKLIGVIIKDARKYGVSEEQFARLINGVMDKYGDTIKFITDDEGNYTIDYEYTKQLVFKSKPYSALVGTLSNMKALLQGIDEYLQATDGYDFVPADIQTMIDTMRSDFALTTAESMQVMHDLRKEKKYKEAKLQERKAIIPCLEDVKVTKEQIRLARKLFGLL